MTDFVDKFIDTQNISIHTPARGVTQFQAGSTQGIIISIHTPARGVTQYDGDKVACVASISIHTPARGVTGTGGCGIRYLPDFNPHSREGSDFHPPQTTQGPCISIHTPARGVTHSIIHIVIQNNTFQSTLPRGE